MFEKENWYKEACEYTSIKPEVAVEVVEKNDPDARRDFFKSYQQGIEYGQRIIQARSKNDRDELMKAWGQQYYNIFKMDFIKVAHENNYTAKFLLNSYSSLCDVKGVVLDYAHWRCNRINPVTRKVEITDESPVPIDDKYDIIFCYTVLEHVWDAKRIVEKFCNSLNEEGLLIETYGGKTGKKVPVKSEDCQRAYDERDASLSLLNNSLVRLRGSNDQEEVRIWRKKPKSLNFFDLARNNIIKNAWHARRLGVRVVKGQLNEN
jgi:SAM-dependent methyltransferase